MLLCRLQLLSSDLWAGPVCVGLLTLAVDDTGEVGEDPLLGEAAGDALPVRGEEAPAGRVPAQRVREEDSLVEHRLCLIQPVLHLLRLLQTVLAPVRSRRGVQICQHVGISTIVSCSLLNPSGFYSYSQPLTPKSVL